jgi:transposase-like protein
MTTNGRGAQLRAELEAFRQHTPRGTLSADLRDRALAYARSRVAQGASAGEVATELGVHPETASRWVRKLAATPPPASVILGSKLSLVPLVVKAPSGDGRQVRVKVELPDGTRVHASGLAVSDVVETIRALRSGG